MSGTFLHPTALVDEGAEIGEGTKVWHFCHVSRGAKIGRDCSLGQNVFVADGAVIGDGCKLQNNVSVYAGVTLERDVFCGPSMVFTNVRTPRAHVSRKSEYAPTLVRRGASIGANATIVCGRTVGAYAIVGAGAVVTRNVPDHALVAGNPARQTGWACRCGELLDLDRGQSRCERCGDEYREEQERLVLVREGGGK